MPRMNEFYDRYWQRREADGWLHTREDMWIPTRTAIAISMIAKTSKPLSCIDIGCGEGTLGMLLRRKFGDSIYLVGCDISEVALSHASAHYDRVFQVDLDSDELVPGAEGETFDYAVCLETLEHLFQPSNLLDRCAEILKSRGEIIASFPNSVWYGYRLELLRGNTPERGMLFHGEHIQDFTLSSFKNLLSNSGFVPSQLDCDIKSPRFLRPSRVFIPLLKRMPNLFGYQIVIKAELDS